MLAGIAKTTYRYHKDCTWSSATVGSTVLWASWTSRKQSASANDTLVAMALATDRPVIVISNPHYPTGVPDQAPTGIASFNPGGREHLRVVAEAIYGRCQLTGQIESHDDT